MWNRALAMLVFILFSLSGCAVLDNTSTERVSIRLPASPEAIAQMRKEMPLLQKMMRLTEVLCREAYPLPSIDECFERIYTGMMSQGDQHTEYLDAKKFKELQDGGRYAGVGAAIEEVGTPPRAVISRVLSGGSAEESGIKAGDAIMQIDGMPYAHFVNFPALIMALRGEPDTTVTLHILREGESTPRVFVLKRRVVRVEEVRSEIVHDGALAYGLMLTRQFGAGFADEVQRNYEELVQKNGKPLDGLIFSVEGNPGGFLYEVINTLDLFMDYPDVSPVLLRTATGMRVFGARQEEYDLLKHTKGDITNGIPIVVMVNESSASSSEVLAAGMKLFHRGTIAGTSDTFQKGVVQTIRPLDETTGVQFTSGEYVVGLAHNWVAVQCFGVSVDISIPPWNRSAMLDAPSGTPSARRTECSSPRAAASQGQMRNAVPHIPMKEANPAHFKAAEAMTAAYILWRKAKMSEQK